MVRHPTTSIHDLADHAHEALRLDNIKLSRQIKELKVRIVDITAKRVQANLELANLHDAYEHTYEDNVDLVRQSDAARNCQRYRMETLQYTTEDSGPWMLAAEVLEALEQNNG